MSIPGSPQNEAIQHSSISTSNGVGSSSSATSAATSAPPISVAATTSNQSTEESQPRRGTKSQPTGSWLPLPPERGWGVVGGPCYSYSSDRNDLNLFLIRFFGLFGVLTPLIAMLMKCNVLSGTDEDKRIGTLGVRCTTHGSTMFLYSYDLFIILCYVYVFGVFFKLYLKAWGGLMGEF